jgi:hypothetical protein
MPDPPDDCGAFIRFPCGLPPGIQPHSACYLSITDCEAVCPQLAFNCHTVNGSCVDGGVVPDEEGGVDLDCSICNNGVGRLPAGLAPATMARGHSALGEYFAAAAHFEAASVYAFRRLSAELDRHAAPRRLRAAARRARHDEVRHAQATAAMARRFGGRPVRPRVTETSVRPLEEMAIENVTEGCVRETFGALVATFQAANASDAGVARLMQSIARDETRHAALSWAVARWSLGRLSADARARVIARFYEAVAELKQHAEAAAAPIPGSGLPTAAERRALVDALERELTSCFARS